jgi:D-alanyl-D-alanine carboxypeptidase
MKKIARLLTICLTAALLAPFCAYARPDWPSDTGILSEAGIVMDVDSKTVLFGQNIHEQKIPASITKLLTALVVIENSSLDETVTFSYDAVYNVESGSGNKLSLEEGDELSVKDCLYALLLQSSNQAANALAEHVAGSRQAFVDMMNEKTEALGCRESHFANPSGLNDDTQRTSAYDMALIADAAYSNETLLEIGSTKRASIPPTKNNPDGLSFSMEHKMLVTKDENSDYYYPDAVAGKTGYTSQAGQTLVTYAVRGDRRLIAVTLKSTDRTHYSDTKNLLEFGFTRFQNLSIAEYETAYVTGEETLTVGGETYEPSELYLDESAVITLPASAEFSDADMTFEEVTEGAPEQAVGKLVYTYNERKVGEATLYTSRPAEEEVQEAVSPAAEESEPLPEEPESTPKKAHISLPSGRTLLFAGAAVLILLLGAGGLFLYRRRQKKEEEQRQLRLEKRKKRLAELGSSEEEFEQLLEERRKERY